jgi:uncharacterized protein (TIGR03435 family)
MSATSRRSFLLFTSAAILAAQSHFEVASIRPAGAGPARPVMEFTPAGGVRATNVTLKMLIQMAYDLRSDQVSGGPAWTDSEQYTVVAKAPEGGPARSPAAQQELARQRLQTLLAERFHLSLAREAVPASGFLLIVDKKGHKLTPSTDPPPGSLRQAGGWELRAEGVEMSIFARFLSVHLQAAVVDRTGLEGRYTFHLDWNPGAPFPAFGLPEDSLLPAVQGQLGLRLERQKVVADRYRIERAERAGEN